LTGFETVIETGLPETPTFCGVKVGVAGETIKPGKMPVPFKAALSDALPDELLTSKAALRAPMAVGRNCTVIPQDAEAASVLPQVVAVNQKSAAFTPDSATP
jgi:hypothetical protein